MTRIRLVATCTLCAVLAVGQSRFAAAADGSPSSLSVKRSHLLGSSSGTLRITPDGIAYETTDKADVRHWNYVEIKQLQIPSPKRIVVLTYEDRGWLRFGADRSFDFEIRDGIVSPEIVAFVLDHTDRPVVTAVLPPMSKPPLFRQLVKHERHARGSDGVLLMYDDALVYGTEHGTDSRYWRFRDIFAVLPLDRDRLQILAYEGGPGELRPFTFELKSEMSDDFARALWARVNPPAPLVGATGAAQAARARSER